MTEQQILLVQQSFAALAPDAGIVADIFYNRLFTLDASLKSMFPADLSEQKRKLMTTLGFAVGSLKKMEELTPALENLGRKHADYGVRDEHYQIVGAALIETLREYLGTGFDAETEAAWASMFAVVAGTMQRAAREAQPAENNSSKSERSSKGEKTMTTAIKNAALLATMIFCFLFFANAARAATFTVTTTADNGDNTTPTAGSLRAAIKATNVNGGSNTIVFSIGSGLKTITPPTPLPVIARSVTIDGTTQPGYNGVPLIELSGANTQNFPAKAGLEIKYSDALNVNIKALIINRFAGGGMIVAGDRFMDSDPISSVSVTVTGSYIGTNAAGTSALANGGDGIRLLDNTGLVTIGGTGANDRNIISGNGGSGISVNTCDRGYIINLGMGSTVIKGNYIGTDASGNNALGNAQSGIVNKCSYSTLVGGNTAADRNLISGNDGIAGIDVELGDLTAKGNYIGTNAAGTAALGNKNDGVYLNSYAIIGGAASNAGNLISGNKANGINIPGGGGSVEGNKIGTNALGTAAVANSTNGIYLKGSADIGSAVSGAGNLISGNGDNGIKIESIYSNQITIKGNRIGVANNGLSRLSNTNSGISIAARGVNVGEAGVAGAQNIISGNFGDGILLTGTDAYNNVIENNLIGTNASGTNVGNFAHGVQITGGAHDNRVGGSNSTAANTITFNLYDGVNIDGDATVNNSVRANSIAANGELGIDLMGTNGVTPNDAGDSDAGANNLQNFPVIQTAFLNTVIGTLNSAPNKSYTIDFYRNTTCNASGNGEGQFYLGSTNVLTDASGSAALNASLAVNQGQILSATATDASGNTSEFAPCFVATAQPGVLSFGAATYAVNENAGTVTIGVSRGFGSTGAVSVNYATSNGTATAGEDYAATNGTLSWTNGDAATKTFTVAITNDPTDEPNETVNLTLSNPTNGAGLLTSTAVLTITDDDAPPTISVSDVSKAEGNQGTTNFTFNISLSAASAQTIAVDFQTANGTATAGIDYAFDGDTIVFTPGQTSKAVTISVSGDTLAELDETFFVNLEDPQNATLAKAQGIATILDDDNAGKLQFGLSGSVSEGAGTATILVSRTNGTAGTVSVDYASSNGTATAGQDYTAVSGTLVFLDGQTNATFNVPILPDNIGEADETVFLTLSNPNGGAALGSPSTRTLKILDDDGGLPAKVSIGGKITETGAALPNVLVTLAGSQSKTALTDANGNYQFANLPGGGNYLVTPTLNGHNFEPFNLSFNNVSANVTNADFAASTGTPARLLRVVNGDTVGGNAVVVPVELISQGNENSLGFSLNYDANLLSNAQVSLGTDTQSASLVVNSQTGKIGVLISLPAGQTFAAGTRQAATVTFLTTPTALYSTPIGFGDAPLARETTDSNAGVLPTAYADGAVTFAQGYEADVAPRPTGSGNGMITVADFTQVGKFVAGTNAMDANYNEFQRADSSPRGTKGNGFLTVSDYTQAGRYAAGLDAVQTSGGASVANLVENYGKNAKAKERDLTAPRNIRIVNTQATPNSQVLVTIEIDASGDENGFGFTLNYDAAKLSNPLVSAGTDAFGTTLIPNTNNAGKVGVIMAFPVNQAIPAGTKQLITIRFDVAANIPSGITPLTFSDAPVFREVVNPNADPLAASFIDGGINILGPTAASVTVGGRIFDANGNALSRVSVSLIDGNGAARTVLSNSFGNYLFTNVRSGETCIISVSSKRYQFSPNTQILFVADDLESVDFKADN